tara:strand:- start:202 stop:636 length:435 start_codon:yes stop_codon:yes gene_type:complete
MKKEIKKSRKSNQDVNVNNELQGTIIQDTDELIISDSVTIEPLALFVYIQNVGGSANYHQIAFHFGLISEDDFKVGVSLTSSERGKIRNAWKKLCGKNATKSPKAFQVNGKGEKWVIRKNGKSEAQGNVSQNLELCKKSDFETK